jgi:hypothetical protein
MVKAIQDGRKTQTRRVIKPHDLRPHEGGYYDCPPKYALGIILWVRETWQKNTIHSEENKRENPYLYKADPDGVLLRSWKSSIVIPLEKTERSMYSKRHGIR